LLCRPVTSHDEQSALLVDGHFHFIADFAFRISRYPFFLPKGSHFPLRLLLQQMLNFAFKYPFFFRIPLIRLSYLFLLIEILVIY